MKSHLISSKILIDERQTDSVQHFPFFFLIAPASPPAAEQTKDLSCRLSTIFDPMIDHACHLTLSCLLWIEPATIGNPQISQSSEN
jgi:hypothetical protein